jgi:hypothetical protein
MLGRSGFRSRDGVGISVFHGKGGGGGWRKRIYREWTRRNANEEEDEEVVFYCDLRSTICYLFLYGFHRTWSRMLQGRTGTGCPSYGEEVIGHQSLGKPKEAASLSSDL